MEVYQKISASGANLRTARNSFLCRQHDTGIRQCFYASSGVELNARNDKVKASRITDSYNFLQFIKSDIFKPIYVLLSNIITVSYFDVFYTI